MEQSMESIRHMVGAPLLESGFHPSQLKAFTPSQGLCSQQGLHRQL